MKLHLPKGLRTALIAAITFFSSAAATLGSAAYADCFLPPLANDQDALALTWCTGTMTGGWNSGLTTERVKTGITNFKLSNPGWYGFLGNGQNAFSTDPKLLKDGNNNVSGFSFCGRLNYNGEAIVSMVSVQDILSGTTDNTLTSFSVSFAGSAASNGIYFSAWAWDGTEATQLVGNSKINGGTFTAQTFSANDLNLKESDKILLSWWNDNGGGALNTVTNITTTFTSKYDAANEGPRNLTWDWGSSCKWEDEVWTLNGGKVAFKDGDNIYFPKLDASFRRISVDGEVAVGNITVQAGNMDSTTISGTAAANMTVESLSLGSNAEFAFAGFENLTFKTLTTESGAEVDVSSVTGKLTVTSKLTGAAENTIILTVIADSITTEAPDLYLAGSYATPDEISKAVKSIASLDSLAGKGYIDESDVNNLGLMGSIIFTEKQNDVQPGSADCSLDIDKRKVVFDKGINFIGVSNGKQTVNVQNRGEMTVNGDVLNNKRMTINVTTGGKLTATEGIFLGHEQNNADYPAWLNLKSAEITTKTIASRNKAASIAFTMSSEVYQLPGNPRPTEQGGTLTITGDSAFGLANASAKFTVNLNAGTLTSTATSMNLVDAAYADSENITIGIGGTFNLNAQDGNTITINHSLTGAGTGTSTVSGTLVFNGAGTVAIANGVDLGNISFNQTNGTLTLAGAITLGDTATFTQAAGKKILLTALEGGGGVTYSNYEGGAVGNGLQQGGAAEVITGGTLNSDVVVTYNGKDYTLTNDNRSIVAEGGSSAIYYVNTATADMSKITAFSADITTVELAGGNLIMDTAKPAAVALDVTADSTLTINEGITINKTDLTIGTGKTLTLAGEGTYALTGSDLGATLGTDWTGTVKLADCTINGLAPNSYANTAGGSSVELSGVDGYFARSNTSTANIILTNSGDKAAYSVTNGYTGTTVTFNGDVSGTGDFQRSNNKGGTQGYTFNGDVSGWTGKAQLASGADATNFTFGGKATEINASVVQKSGAAIGININNNEAVSINGTIGADGGAGAINITTDGTGAKTFNGAVDATTLTVSAGSAIIKDSLTATGTVTVASGATLDLSGSSNASAGALNLAGGSTLVIGSDAMTLTGLTLTGVSGSSLLNIQGLGTEAVLFTGLAAETDITNITFTDKLDKRVANAADYISGVESGTWLVYDATATTLSFASSLSPDLFWTAGTGTWDAAALWSKTPDGTADSTFVEEGNITFSGQTGVTVTLAEPATAGGVTIKDGGYTFAGGRLTVLKRLNVTNADATFQDGVVLDDSNVTVGAGSTLTLGADTTMKGLSNAGTVDLGGNALTLSTATTKGGTVTAGDMTLTGDNTFTSLNATGAVTGADSLTLGGDSSIGSLADGTKLTVNAGTTSIGAATALDSLAGAGSLTTDGDLTLTNGGSIGNLTVTDGKLTIGAPLTVTGTLAGLTELEATALPANGPVLTAGSIANAFTFTTTEALLTNLGLSYGESWTLISGSAAPDVTFTSTGSDTVVIGESKYVLGTSGDSVTISLFRGGNEWVGDTSAITWDGSDAGWSGGAPSATNAANLLGSGASEVVVVGDQSVSKILVDTEGGNTQAYTLSGDGVTTGSIEIINGNLTIANETKAGTTSVAEAANLTIGENGRLTTDALTVDNADSISIGQGGTLELTSGSVSNDILANNKGLVIMDSLTDGGTIGGDIQVSKDGTFTGSYQEGTMVFATGGKQTLKADQNLTICGGSGATFQLTNADNGSLGAIGTTGADVTFTGTNLNLAGGSSMTGGTLTLAFSAENAITNAGDKGAVDAAFTGEALQLNGVRIVLNQTDGESGVSITPADNGQMEGVVLYAISTASGSSFDDATSVTVNSDILSKYFKNFRLEQGSIYLVADRDLSHYENAFTALSPNGNTGLTLADTALALLAPQEDPGNNPDLAAVMDSLDTFAQNNDATRADRLAAAVAGSATTALSAATAGDMDRQLRAIRNRTVCMGTPEFAYTGEDIPNIWFNAEADFHQLNADGTAAGYTLNSWGGTIGMDYDFSSNFTAGLAITSMFGKVSADAPEASTSGDISTYYFTAFGRYAKGAWVNTFIAAVGVSDISFSRTVATGNGAYTTDGDTSGLSFGLLYELAYTIPTSADGGTCIQPVFNVAYKHITVDGYTEKGSDAALRVGDQSLDSVTFGLGARMQTTLGETLYNRTSVLELRALAKLEVGDRTSSADVSFASLPGHSGRVEGAEVSPVSLELGAGLYIPVGVESGTLFMDVSADIRDNAPSVNGTVGYRITF